MENDGEEAERGEDNEILSTRLETGCWQRHFIRISYMN